MFIAVFLNVGSLYLLERIIAEVISMIVLLSVLSVYNLGILFQCSDILLDNIN